MALMELCFSWSINIHSTDKSFIHIEHIHIFLISKQNYIVNFYFYPHFKNTALKNFKETADMVNPHLCLSAGFEGGVWGNRRWISFDKSGNLIYIPEWVAQCKEKAKFANVDIVGSIQKWEFLMLWPKKNIFPSSYLSLYLVKHFQSGLI